MGILSTLKDIFFNKEEVGEVSPDSSAEVTPISTAEPLPTPKEDYGKKIDECYDCKQPIESWQKRRHWGGQAYHKDCLRKLIKQAKHYINN